MAYIVNNPKGFKVIQINRAELLGKLSQLGSVGICDFCNNTSTKGYYIAVLNSWYCEKCYKNWLIRAKHYVDDFDIEDKNFEYFKKIFGL